MKSNKKKIHKLIKKMVRENFIKQGGNDGRFIEKTIPNKKRKYNRQKAKKINSED